ncbi:MAG: glycosyltransferase, partial [Planctomycetota bacterium]
MSDDTELRPRGFGGTIDCWQELLPTGGRVLRLPLQGVRDGPFVKIPADGAPYDVILVESLAECLGHLELFLKDAASRLAPGGALMVDMENLAAPRSVRFALEGRPGVMDPAGSSRQPERRVHKRRALAALAAAGLVLEEVYEVPSRPEEIGPEFMRNIFREGFLALLYVGGPPPARLWIVGRKEDQRQGTVLVGAGDPERQQRTVQCLERFLPDSWQLLTCTHTDDDDREAQAFNRGIVRSRGELLWFLRAGATVDGTLFQNLVARTVISPVAPAAEDAGELRNAGDISGVMVPRTLVFQTGPLSPEWCCDQVAYEDWCLRLEAITHSIHGVAGSYTHVGLGRPDTDRFATESEHLLTRWAAIEKDESGHASLDDPRARAGGDPVAPWAGREPRISLCMIVKNEERFLDACLRSAAPCVDEMIVVDTGSTDRTVDIAQSHGATVKHFEWCDDFAAARNAALEHASGDWILSLDADEVLTPETPAKVRELVKDPGVAGYHMRFQNLYTSKRTVGVIMVRLFRNLPGVQWVNRIHEQITPELAEIAERDGLIMSISDAEVEHHGYKDDVIDHRQKNERNDRLFRLHLEDHPDDIYMLYKYGDFLRRHTERWAEARDCLRRAFDLIARKPPSAPRAIPYASEIAALLVLEYMRENRSTEAEEILEHALRRFMPTPNLHYLAAGLALANGDSDDAIHHYERCLSYRDQVMVVPIQEGITSHVSITGIAQALMQKDSRERARQLLHQSQQIEPGYDVTALALSRL